MPFLCDRCLNNRYDVDAPAAAESQVSRFSYDIGRQLTAQRTWAVESGSAANIASTTRSDNSWIPPKSKLTKAESDERLSKNLYRLLSLS